MLLLAFLPALGWGIMPIIANLTKGKPNEQLLGTTATALLFGAVFFIWTIPAFNPTILLVGLASGAFWAIGQYLQFQSFVRLPVSEAMPISNGTQLIGTTLIAALFFKEWSTGLSIGLGIAAIFIIILGIYLTNYSEAQNVQQSKKSAIISLLLSSCALTAYVTIPKVFDLSGAEIIFPQAIGMFMTALFINLPQYKQLRFTKIRLNLVTGLAWSIANLSLFLVMPTLGVAKSFTLSQLAVLVSLFTGILVFRPAKTKKEWRAILFGAVLITLGISLISMLKN